LRVKICGITNIKDALNAIKYKADALGFVLYKPSPRYIEPEEIKKIINKLPPYVEKIGLFVNENSDFINKISSLVKFNSVQIIDCKDKENIIIPYIEVYRIQEQKDLLKLNLDRYHMIDAYVQGYGGKGSSIPLEYFNNIDCSKIILAGGVDIKNIKQIKKYGFYAVDVSSSVEISKGIKDKNKIKQFIGLAKEKL
jgi:phosphoribosylanthranilate isomerase